MGRKVWIDGDSVARDARRVAERHAEGRSYELTIVADRPISVSRAAAVEVIELETGEEAVDNYILSAVAEGDLVITRDILLAERLISQGVYVLNDRGEEFTPENIEKRRSERDMMQVLRESGMVASGRRRYGKSELKAFADAFDIFLTKRLQ